MLYVNSYIIGEINTAIRTTFPKLNTTDSEFLSDLLSRVVELIAIKMNFDLDNREIYDYQLKQNDRRDLVGLLLLLLPFMDDDGGEKKKELTRLSDIYTYKKDGQYYFSNIQNNRCIRNEDQPQDKKYDPAHVKHNYSLLLDSIQKVSCRMYVTWIDIIPLTWTNYRESPMFQNTQVDELSHWNEKENWEKYRGMNIELFYDIMVHHLYQKIRRVKWLLFEKNIDGSNQIFLDLLKNYFQIDKLMENDDSEYKEFQKDWKGFLENRAGLDEDTHQNLVRYWSIFFQFSPTKPQGLTDLYKIDESTEIEEGDIKFLDKDFYEVLNYVKKVDALVMLKFLKYSLRTLKSTWYGQKIVRGETDADYSLKNVYNFCKLLVNYNDSKGVFRLQAPYYASLVSSQKDEILQKIKDPDGRWFQIGRILQSQGVPRGDTNRIQTRIYQGVHRDLVDIVFQAGIVDGILTRYRPNSAVTDKKNSPNVPTKIANGHKYMKKSKELDKWLEEGYYYLTSTRYKDITNFKQNLLEGKGSVWYMIHYAMDWITQLGFFHRFINCRVWYVTGSTGVGKSTQFPKLCLYALKSIYFKYDGKVICTQPRINATVGNSETISSQFGVSINEKDPSYPGKQYYHMQYKTGTRSYVDQDTEYFLRMTTDGTLVEELKNSPVMLQERKGGFVNKNKYDVILVDESHEHNPNMDLILSLMKYCVHYNAFCKLGIISATMEDDEPRYRNFFRDVNDNICYPPNDFLKNMGLDRINIERRIHISPPGETTIYRVVETYHPEYGFDKSKGEYQDVRFIQEKLIPTKPKGEILVFRPGEAEVMDAVNKLNQSLPSNMIALPYLSVLTQEEKDRIESIDKGRKPNQEIDLKDFLKGKPYGNPQNSSGIFNNVIIVATTIAEASITIDTLRYVVDTGVSKTPVYDYSRNISTLGTIPISDTSRKQRRGRVGRTADGTVFYMYGKDFTQKRAPPFSVVDIRDMIFGLIQDTSGKNLANLINPVLEEQSRLGYDTPFNYYGQESAYDYNNRLAPAERTLTGYDIRTLEDPAGYLFAVSPIEQCLHREIDGRIRTIDNPCKIGDTEVPVNKIELIRKYFECLGFLDSHGEKTVLGKFTSNIKLLGEYNLVDVENNTKELEKRFILGYYYAKQLEVEDIYAYLLPGLCLGTWDLRKLLVDSTPAGWLQFKKKHYMITDDMQALYRITRNAVKYDKKNILARWCEYHGFKAKPMGKLVDLYKDITKQISIEETWQKTEVSDPKSKKKLDLIQSELLVWRKEFSAKEVTAFYQIIRIAINNDQKNLLSKWSASHNYGKEIGQELMNIFQDIQSHLESETNVTRRGIAQKIVEVFGQIQKHKDENEIGMDFSYRPEDRMERVRLALALASKQTIYSRLDGSRYLINYLTRDSKSLVPVLQSKDMEITFCKKYPHMLALGAAASKAETGLSFLIRMTPKILEIIENPVCAEDGNKTERRMNRQIFGPNTSTVFGVHTYLNWY